jgi:uncharacterized protein (TIGR02217 family)
MAFHDVTLPEGFQYGSVSGAGFGTIIQQTASGHEVRVARQAQGQHRLTLLAQLRTADEAKALKRFALQRRGALHSFRIKDFADYTTNDDGETAPTATDQILGTGDGTTTTFQLIKTYGQGEDGEYVRTLTLPVGGSIVAAIDGTPVVGLAVSGSGLLTLPSVPANGAVVTAGCEFDVPVRFSLEFDRWARLRADAFQQWSIEMLDVVEVLDEVEQPERWNFGGGTNWGEVSTDFAIAFNNGCLQYIDPTTDISVFLPIPTDALTGPTVFRIANAGGSGGDIQVREDDGTALGAVIVPGDNKVISLVRVDADTAIWLIED